MGKVLGLVLVLVLAVGHPVGAQPAPVQLSLQDAVRRAVEQNPQARSAALDVLIARSQLAQARAASLPTVSGSGSASYTGNRSPSTFTIPPGTFGNPDPITITIPPQPPALLGVSLTITYPLYTGGRLQAQRAIAEANVRGAEATLVRVLQTVAFQTRQAYLSVLLGREGVAAAQRALAAADESLRVAAARVQAGVSPRFDQIQAEVGVAQARQALVRAEGGVALASQGLAALAALPLGTPIEPTDPLRADVAVAGLDVLAARAAEQRPELRELAARQAAARAAIELARSGARPNVVAQGGVNAGTVFAGSVETTWSVTLAATLNLFDGGITRERVREAELRVQQLQQVEAQTRTAIELDVRQSHIALQQARAELAATDRLIAQAQEALRIARVRFQAGVSTSLEVTQAQAALAQAEQARAAALFNLNLAVAQLERAVGGSPQ